MKGEFHLVIKEMKFHNHALFLACFCMSPTKYKQLLGILVPRILKHQALPYIFLRMMFIQQLQHVFVLALHEKFTKLQPLSGNPW